MIKIDTWAAIEIMKALEPVKPKPLEFVPSDRPIPFDGFIGNVSGFNIINHKRKR
jgi:hypothetical protein